MAKRGNFEGTIYQLKNGKWRAQYTFFRQRLSFVAKTKAECLTWIEKLRSQSSDSPQENETFQTLSEYLAKWLKQIGMDIRPTTLYQYNLYCEKYILPRLGRYHLYQVRLQMIQEMYSDLHREGIGARTIHIIHNVLHHALEDAYVAGYIKKNPAQGARHPKVIHKEMKVYNTDQVNQMLLAAQDDPYQALYHLALVTGMRQSELLGLKWGDVDIHRGFVKVERQLKRSYQGMDYFTQTKTSNGKRVIQIGIQTIQKLQDHYGLQQWIKGKAGKYWVENDLVFPSSIGTPLNHANLYRRFIGLLDKAGLPHIRFHDLRHISATLLLLHKIPLMVVSQRLGHYKPSFTMDTYGHMIPEMQEEAAKLIDDLITPVRIQLHTVAHDAIL
jgi:integrase